MEIPLPIETMTYARAMEEYGSDAPDLRYDLKLVELTDLVGSGLKVFSRAVETGAWRPVQQADAARS